MKKPVRTVIIILAAAAFLFGGFCAVSRIVFRRSPMATAAEIFLRLGGVVKKMSEEEAEGYLEARSGSEEELPTLPENKLKSRAHTEERFGCTVFVFEGSDEPDNTVIYMHGGAYVNEMTAFHIFYCDKLAASANARVIAPLYPLAPDHGYAETYELMRGLFTEESEKELPVTLMGDSAGGGFAAAFCEYLISEGLPLPSRLVLFSPWVDISMSGSGYDELASVDPMLNRERLIPMGKAWAKELDTKDPLVSPLFGDVTGFPPTLIYVGTREILLYDVKAFYEKLTSSGADAKLIVGEGMNHVYPIYPIPEAEAALGETVDFIRSAK